MKSTKISVKIKLTTEMLGTVPKNKEIYENYIESKKPLPKKSNTEERTLELEKAADEDETKTVEQIEEKGWTGFHKDDVGIFVYDYFIKGFFKNAGNVLKDEMKLKAVKSKLDNYLFVFPRRVYLLPCNPEAVGCITEPDGVLERPLRAMTMQGPRVSLARSDYVDAGTRLHFELELLEHKEITTDVLEELLSYGTRMGLGQFRNGGYGRFEVEEFIVSPK